MSLSLTTPKSKKIQLIIDKEIIDLKITNIYIRYEKSRIDIYYKNGYSDGQGGIVYDNEESFIIIQNDNSEPKIVLDEEGNQVVIPVPQLFTEMVARNGATYTALKNSLYNELKLSLGVNGNIV